MIELAIPAITPATMSSPITPTPPFASLSILPMIDGFLISKYLKKAKERILCIKNPFCHTPTSFMLTPKAGAMLRANHIPASSSITMRLSSWMPVFSSYLFISFIAMILMRIEAKTESVCQNI